MTTLVVLIATTGWLHAAVDNPLPLAQTIPLKGVSGRIDHMSADPDGNRLFVAALGNNTVEVMDLAAGKRSGTIRNLSEPQGVLFVPEFNRVVVANGRDGSVRFYDGSSLQLVKSVDFKDDADNLRYDSAAKRIYVGYGSGALGVLDAQTGRRVADIPLAGHPESFQLETKGKRIFVNVPTATQIAMIDREKASVVATWPLKQARSNFPMALDEGHHRLFIGCRSPARLLVVDTESGNMITALACVGDADDVFYDDTARRIYVCGGGGEIDVFEQIASDQYNLISETPTATLARTCLLVPARKALYVAVPRQILRDAELRIYSLP